MPDTGENGNTNANAQLSADALGLNGPAAFASATDYMQISQIAQNLAVQFGVNAAVAYLTQDFAVPAQVAFGVAVAYGTQAAYDYLTGGLSGPTNAMGGMGYPGPAFDFSDAVIDPATGTIEGFY